MPLATFEEKYRDVSPNLATYAQVPLAKTR